MSSTKVKDLRDFEVKEVGGLGILSAVFATFDTGPDSDGDVYAPGAFEDGAQVPMSAWNHSSNIGSAPPIGAGTIRTSATVALFEARLFLGTSAGRDHYEVIKELGALGLGQWSYGYDILDAAPGVWRGQRVRVLKRMLVHEVSPVLRAAGNNTHTTEVRSAALSPGMRRELDGIRQRLAATHPADTQDLMRLEMSRIHHAVGGGRR